MTNLKWIFYDIKYWIIDALSDALWWLVGEPPEKQEEKFTLSASQYEELVNIVQEEAYYNQFSDRDWMW